MTRVRGLACILALLVAGCSSTGVGNPGVSSLSLSVVSDPEAQDEAEDLPSSEIQDAVVVIGELRFQPCDPNQGSEQVVAGPFIVDLKAGITTPGIPDVLDTPGGYCGFKAPLAPATSAALDGRSLFFDGTRADGTFFIVYANMTGTLKVRATPDRIWQGMDTPPKFFWALRPRRWLLKSELDDAVPMPDDSHQRAVVIDADRYMKLYLAIRSRLAGMSTLYADADGNGTFTDSDRQAVVGVGLDNTDP